MPNSLNYGTALTTTEYQRPSRIFQADLQLLESTDVPIIFGVRDTDVVELWIYNSDGSFAGHVNVATTDAILRQATFIGQSGAFETINIDLRTIADTIDLQPGRYAMVANFFRNEVGSENGNKLYIADISNDRTELRLLPVSASADMNADIFDFIVPSVPRQFAKGLIDELFGTALSEPPEDKITSSQIETIIDETIPGTMHRIGQSQTFQQYLNLYGLIMTRTYIQTLNNMADDVFNYNVQQIEIEGYITKALHDVIYNIKQTGEYDPRFILV